MCISIHVHCTCTSANSVVSLKGELSKPRLFPGELASTKPKSMWMMWPSESTKMLPLCLCTAECKQHACINHGCECIKSPAPEGHRPKEEWATCIIICVTYISRHKLHVHIHVCTMYSTYILRKVAMVMVVASNNRLATIYHVKMTRNHVEQSTAWLSSKEIQSAVKLL